jgi:hypothetical protein
MQGVTITARSLTPLLLDTVSQALKAEAPEENRTGWISQCADDLQVSESSFKDWLYGKGLPGAPALVALCAYFGPRFANKVFGHVRLKLTEVA